MKPKLSLDWSLVKRGEHPCDCDKELFPHNVFLLRFYFGVAGWLGTEGVVGGWEVGGGGGGEGEVPCGARPGHVENSSVRLLESVLECCPVLLMLGMLRCQSAFFFFFFFFFFVRRLESTARFHCLINRSQNRFHER